MIRLRHAHESLCQFVCVGKDRVPQCIDGRADIERPQHSRDTEEETPIRDVDALTDASPRAEGEVVPLGHIRVTRRVVGRLEIVLEPVRVELSGVRVAVLVHVDGPDVVDHAGAGGDAVAHVVVVSVSGEGVRDGAEDGGGHPAQGLLHAAADVLQVGLVVHGGEAAVSHDGVNLSLGALLHFGKQHHGLDEAVERAGGRVGSGFKQSARDVRCLVVAESLLLLHLGHVDAEAGLRGAIADGLLAVQPVLSVQLLLAGVEGFRFSSQGQHPVRQFAQPGEEVDQCCRSCLVDHGEFLEAVEELLDVWVVVCGGSPAKVHSLGTLQRNFHGYISGQGEDELPDSPKNHACGERI